MLTAKTFNLSESKIRTKSILPRHPKQLLLEGAPDNLVFGVCIVDTYYNLHFLLLYSIVVIVFASHLRFSDEALSFSE